MFSEVITSAQNPKIKRLLALQQKSSERREAGLFVVEGQRELQHCIDAGYDIDTIFVLADDVCEVAASPTNLPLRSIPPTASGSGPLPLTCPRVDTDLSGEQQTSLSSARVYRVSSEVYEKIAYRGSTEGVIAEVKAKHISLSGLKIRENPLIAVLESVEKPGNLGAVLRSADAAGVDAVIICDPLTDLYNPNLIRASIGGIFSVPCVACSSEEAIKWLKDNNIQILTAQLQDSSLYYDKDMTRGTAIVMGTESTGLTDIWRKAADAHIRIPMLGQLDSLNVSVSAAILLYEAVRQRSSR